MTETETQLTETTGPAISRRTLLRSTAAATGAATVATTGSTTISSHGGTARAALPLVPIGAGAAAKISGGALVGGSLVGGAWSVSEYLGDGDDYSGYTGEAALHTNVELGAVEMKETTEQVLSSLENIAEFSANAAIPKGMAAVVEELNDGGDQSSATTALEEAIDDYFTGPISDVIDHYKSQREQAAHYSESFAEHEHDFGDPFTVYVPPTEYEYSQYAHSWLTADTDASAVHSVEYEYPDGSTESVVVYDNDGSIDQWHAPHYSLVEDLSGHDRDDGFGAVRLEEETYEDHEDVSEVVFFEAERYHNIIQELRETRDEVYTELSTFVSDVFEEYEAGEIDLSDFVDPMTAYTELSNDLDEFAYAGAAANMLGIPRNDAPMDIYLEESEVEVIGSIYATEAPEDGFDVGTSHDPASYDFPIFIRYDGVFEADDGEVQEEVDFVELEQPFEILSATDPETGDEVDSVGMDEGPTYDPSDLDGLQEQLDQIREEQLAMQAEAQSGGGGFDWSQLEAFGLPGEAIAGAIAVIALIGAGAATGS